MVQKSHSQPPEIHKTAVNDWGRIIPMDVSGFHNHGDRKSKLSHEKNPLTFHYTGWLKGILRTVYYNPNITG